MRGNLKILAMMTAVWIGVMGYVVTTRAAAQCCASTTAGAAAQQGGQRAGGQRAGGQRGQQGLPRALRMS